MPMTWNEKADAKLLIGILNTSIPKIDYTKLAEFMGSECTEIAVKRRIQRLREHVHSSCAATSGEGAGEGSSSLPATPEKRKRVKAAAAAAGGKTKSPAKKVKAGENGDSNGMSEAVEGA